MHEDLKKQVETLAKLPDVALQCVVSELAGIFKTEMPIYEPGSDKREYALAVLTEVDAACKKMTPLQAVAKAGEVMDYNEKHNPGMWSKIMTFLKFDNRKN